MTKPIMSPARKRAIARFNTAKRHLKIARANLERAQRLVDETKLLKERQREIQRDGL